MTPTLPGSLPGLLRVGSPVLFDISEHGQGSWRAAVVSGLGDYGAKVSLSGSIFSAPRCLRPEQVSLDLTDPTGRIHALWWAEAQKPLDGRHMLDMVGVSPVEMRIIIRSVTRGRELTGPEVERFRRLCLSYAGFASV